MVAVMMREVGGDEVKKVFLAASPSLARLDMEWEADELACFLGTTVQECRDGHLHVVKAVDHKGVGAEFWTEDEDEDETSGQIARPVPEGWGDV